MPSYREIAYGIYGAWRLARLDQDAMRYFDCTIEGFWKSFFAAVIVLPGFVIIMVFELNQLEVGAGVVRLVLVLACVYVLSWVAYPVIVHSICEAIGKRDAFIGFIVAFNWANVIQMAIWLPTIGLIGAGLLPRELGWLLHGIMLFLILGYAWFIAHTALGVTPMGAVGFVALDFIIGRIIQAVTLGLIQ